MIDFFSNISITDAFLLILIVEIAYIGEKIIAHLQDISVAAYKTDGEKAREKFELENPEAML
jgi:hypothetical protein